MVELEFWDERRGVTVVRVSRDLAMIPGAGDLVISPTTRSPASTGTSESPRGTSITARTAPWSRSGSFARSCDRRACCAPIAANGTRAGGDGHSRSHAECVGTRSPGKRRPGQVAASRASRRGDVRDVLEERFDHVRMCPAATSNRSDGSTVRWNSSGGSWTSGSSCSEAGSMVLRWSFHGPRRTAISSASR